MIRFACKPGKIFTAVITRSLEDVISDLEENILLNDDEQIFFEDKIVESFGGKIKGLQLICREFKKILEAHHSEKIYTLTDRHFQLLDRVLGIFCDVYTGTARDIISEPKELKKNKDYLLYHNEKPIFELDSGLLMDIYFWDCDYDFPIDTAQFLKEDKTGFRDYFDVSREAIGASLGSPVDGSDLRIEEYESDWDDKEENDSWIDELDN